MKPICRKCGKPITGEYRQILMIGPQGYRRYPVHIEHAGNVPVSRGGRQNAKRKAKGERHVQE